MHPLTDFRFARSKRFTCIKALGQFRQNDNLCFASHFPPSEYGKLRRIDGVEKSRKGQGL